MAWEAPARLPSDTASLRGRSSDFRDSRESRVEVTAAGLCRTLTGFPILPSRGTSCLSSVTIASPRRVPVPAPRSVTVVGIGADGWSRPVAGWPATRVEAADVVLGGTAPPRLLPEVDRPGARGAAVAAARGAAAPCCATYAERAVVVLASGDPLVSGIGSTLVDAASAPTSSRCMPAVSSVALARARMGWSAETTQVVSAGRPRPAPASCASSRPATGCWCCPPTRRRRRRGRRC